MNQIHDLNKKTDFWVLEFERYHEMKEETRLKTILINVISEANDSLVEKRQTVDIKLLR